MSNPLLDVVQEQSKGNAVGVYSVCSANKYVLKASMLQAKNDKSGLLVEPTVNQVNQFGGYTGMQPGDFVEYLHRLAADVDFPVDRLILGGDHLGPNPWKNESAETAMEKSRTLVEQYVKAGYTKIHLDTSIPCADDDVPPHTPMSDEVVAQRAAELCKIAEKTYKDTEHSGEPVYIIGTEVPIPGGAEGSLYDLEVTSLEAAQKTLEVTKEAFFTRGLEDAWERVIAQVVQPGVEFGNDSVVEYDPEKAAELSEFVEQYNDKIFEAHSTDYQSLDGLSNLVRDHFAILKVGPWLTFAFREAVFGLSYIEEELLGSDKSFNLSNFRQVQEQTMLENPASWENHYHGDSADLALLRKYSYSDRSRYYWQQPAVQTALETLFSNLRANEIPLTLLSQFLPDQYQAIRDGVLTNEPEAIALHKIQEITELYSQATEFHKIF